MMWQVYFILPGVNAPDLSASCAEVNPQVFDRAISFIVQFITSVCYYRFNVKMLVMHVTTFLLLPFVT